MTEGRRQARLLRGFPAMLVAGVLAASTVTVGGAAQRIVLGEYFTNQY